MSGMEGICSGCGAHYYGWALESPYKQLCSNCGSTLEIRRDGIPFSSGFLPFKAAATMELRSPKLFTAENRDQIQN